MDKQLTSQVVGREFVRQYYTVLHESPLEMHRFYNDKSSYLHGGDEQAGHELPPVCGQKKIHSKIKSLNFRNCHAKIRQVDSHTSVAESVVVQVSGELSNNGERMRRFMQTFVLVPLSAKSYYVHNDIFRYQDQVFHQVDHVVVEHVVEDLVEAEIDSINDEMNVDCRNMNDHYDDSVVENHAIGEHTYENYETYEEANIENEVPLMNGNSNEMAYNTNTEGDLSQISAETEEANEEHVVAASEPVEVVKKRPTTPMSWAARASKNNPIKDTVKSVPVSENTNPEKESHKVESRITNVPVKEDDRPVQSRIPDNQQVFVGNIPLNANEVALKKFFEQFGEVIHVKLNNKTKPTAQGLFAFVCYSSPGYVLKVLKSAPLKFEGQNINVEEKKDSSKKFSNPNKKTRNNSRGGLINKSKGHMITAGGRH